MWTEATGWRTPIGGLGTFWDDPANILILAKYFDFLHFLMIKSYCAHHSCLPLAGIFSTQIPAIGRRKG